MTELTPSRVVGETVHRRDSGPFQRGRYYGAESEQVELIYDVPEGTLTSDRYLTYDFLIENTQSVRFEIVFQETSDGLVDRLAATVRDVPEWLVHYHGVQQCGARVRIPLSAVDLDQLYFPREGAWLKPAMGGDRISLEDVGRIKIGLYDLDDAEVRWWQTPIEVTDEEPSRLTDPPLLDGPVVDELGQFVHDDWDGKSASATQVVERLREQQEAAETRTAAAETRTRLADYSRYGGSASAELAATGYFRTHHDGERWWLVDPDGHPFWSSGINAINPVVDAAYETLEDALAWLPQADGRFEPARDRREGSPTVNYLVANFVRAFGPDDWYERWRDVTLDQFERFGFNTFGAWSDWEVARDAEVPYVRRLPDEFERVQSIYRDFPDVYHPDFVEDVRANARVLSETARDSSMIGFFLQNEPAWFFANETPATGMLFTTEACASRRELADHLREKYGSESALSRAWKLDVTFDQIRRGRWERRLTSEARSDLRAFSSAMVEHLYETWSEACRDVDPNHLNFGTRLPAPPPEWTWDGVEQFDVLTLNSYGDRVPTAEFSAISDRLEMPILIGEYSASGNDVGLAAGIAAVGTQTDRVEYFRRYFETAAAEPWCVGSHFFRLYDQPAIGGPRGENHNVGLLDICNRVHEPLGRTVRSCHERLYSELRPFDGD